MLILTYAMNWSFSAFSWSAILACCLIQRSSSCWLSCSTFLYFSSRPVYVSCKAWCSSFNIYKQREKTISQSSWKKITFSTKKRINRQERTTVTNRERKQLIRFNPLSFWDILLTWGSPNLEKLTLDFNLPLQKEHVEEKRNQDQKLIYSVLWPCSLLSWKENRNLASSFFPGLSYHSKPNVNLLLMSMETLQKDLELVKHKKIQLELIFYNKSNIGTWFVASNSIMVLSRFLISIFKANSLASKSFSLEKTSIQILKLIWLYLYTYNNWVWKKLL